MPFTSGSEWSAPHEQGHTPTRTRPSNATDLPANARTAKHPVSSSRKRGNCSAATSSIRNPPSSSTTRSPSSSAVRTPHPSPHPSECPDTLSLVRSSPLVHHRGRPRATRARRTRSRRRSACCARACAGVSPRRTGGIYAPRVRGRPARSHAGGGTTGPRRRRDGVPAACGAARRRGGYGPVPALRDTHAWF